MALQIDKHIPITPAVKRPRGKYRDLVDNMEPGDSVALPNTKEATAFATTIRRHKGAPSIRIQKDGSYRVWLTESNEGETL